MIDSPITHQKHDRLVAFLKAFGLEAEIENNPSSANPANLFVTVDTAGGSASQIIFQISEGPPPQGNFAFVAAAKVDFGGPANPLVGALPERLTFPLDQYPAMQGLADLFVAEAQISRCGGGVLQSRLCEVIVVLAIRRAIEVGTVNAGLLAGLAHPDLHRSLVAMHDDPAKPWRVESLAEVAGMSRSHFIVQFRATVGQTPGAYLTAWRLALGRRQIEAGHSVKAVAQHVGFGSAAAFSRAFSRKYARAPASFAKQAIPTR